MNQDRDLAEAYEYSTSLYEIAKTSNYDNIINNILK